MLMFIEIKNRRKDLNFLQRLNNFKLKFQRFGIWLPVVVTRAIFVPSSSVMLTS